MNFKKALGLGVLLWVLVFVIVSILVGFKVYDGIWMEIAVAVLTGIISLILAGYAKPKSFGSALGYGILWVVVALILNWAISTRFNSEIFSSWTYWLSMVLVLIAPLARINRISGHKPEAVI